MDEARQRQLEEAVAFADQRADGLDAALLDVSERMAAMTRRLELLEDRLRALETVGDDAVEGEADPVTDRPPHSGRLPGGR